MKILITGFEPLREFWSVNPSWEAVKRLPNKILSADVIREELPIIYDLAEEKLKNLITEHQPDVVINVGQSGDEGGIILERIGINLDDFNVVDNAGNMRVDKKIVEDGPDAYFTTLPCRKIVEAIKENGIPAVLSETAGTHLCNHVTYYTRHIIETEGLQTISGFIHIPMDRSQCVNGRAVGRHFMEIDVVKRALEVTIETIVKHFEEKNNPKI